MQADELVIRQILIEGADNPVTVQPAAIGRILPVRGVVGIAGEIQPDACPAFAKMRRREQSSYLVLISQRRIILEEGFQFLRSGGQADQIEGDSTEQRGAVRFRTGVELLFQLLRSNERIKRTPDPGGVGHRWYGRGAYWLKRPELAAGCEIDLGGRRTGGDLVVGQGGSVAHPPFKNRDFLGGQLGIGRHFQIGIGITDDSQQQSFVGRFLRKHATPSPPRSNSGSRIQNQCAIIGARVSGMALIAPLGQQWADLGLEELKLGSQWHRGGLCSGIFGPDGRYRRQNTRHRDDQQPISSHAGQHLRGPGRNQ